MTECYGTEACPGDDFAVILRQLQQASFERGVWAPIFSGRCWLSESVFEGAVAVLLNSASKAFVVFGARDYS